MTDIVERLREWAEMMRTHGAIPNGHMMIEAADEIERLRAALQRIDAINDDPMRFRTDINEVVTTALGKSDG